MHIPASKTANPTWGTMGGAAMSSIIFNASGLQLCGVIAAKLKEVCILASTHPTPNTYRLHIVLNLGAMLGTQLQDTTKDSFGRSHPSHWERVRKWHLGKSQHIAKNSEPEQVPVIQISQAWPFLFDTRK